MAASGGWALIGYVPTMQGEKSKGLTQKMIVMKLTIAGTATIPVAGYRENSVRTTRKR